MGFRSRAAIPGIFLALAAFSLSRADSVYRASFSEYVEVASAIVQGKVISQEAVFPKSGPVHTRVSVQVDSVLKGQAGATVLVLVPGGTQGDQRVRVAGAPSLKKDDELLLFLWRPPEGGDTVLLGLGHGVYRIFRPEPKGEAFVQGDHARPEEKLSSLVSRIREELQRIESKK